MLNADSNQLKFGIDQILSPHFGNVSFCSTSATSSPVSTSSQAASPNSNTSGIASPSSISPSFQFGVDVIYPWVYSTRYSDRPSAGPRKPKPRKRESTGSSSTGSSEEEKRPRTAFTSYQLDRLNQEFTKNRYLTEKRRQELAHELGLHESQIKIWFQNKRAKLKKSHGDRPHLNYPLIAQLAQSQAKSS